MKRSLIVNADDFGYTRGVNSAIARCCAEGILRSTTIMANGAAFEHGVAVAKASGRLGVGVHLVLTELAPLAPAGELPGLVGEDGLMPASPGALAKAAALGRLSRETIRKELDRQVSRVLDCSIPVTHLDSHKHVHILPVVLDAALDVARKYRIGWIRNPFDRTPPVGILGVLDQKELFLKQYAEARAIFLLRRAFFERIRKAGLRTPDRFYGIGLTGIWTEAAAERLVKALPPGVSEWMVHPGDCDAELRANRTRLLESREAERNILLSPAVAGLLKKYDVHLQHFGEDF
ncbi:MAG: carbohydrate deacetylase [Acidobacteriota bacterium]